MLQRRDEKVAAKSQITERDMAKCSNTTKKMLGIRWTIENVSRIACNDKVVGPSFYLAPECILSISFEKGELWIYVCLCNKSDTKITIQRTLAFFGYGNKKLHEEKNINAIFSLEKDKDVLMTAALRSDIFENLTYDELTIDLCVSIKEAATENLNRLVRDIDPERRLKEDFKMMLENPINSDVSLQVGGERIPAHWSILCSRSSYFREMYDSRMRESVQNSITFTDLTIRTVRNLIRFLYTADFVEKDDFQELFDLYYAADKYEVMDLRALCGHKIISNITTDNASEILQLCHRHNDKALKMEVMDFIHLHSDAVFRTEGWKKFEASEPAIAELVIFFCLKKN